MFAVIERNEAKSPEARDEARAAPRPELTVIAGKTAPAPRDWSNVVFSPAFCEEARRNWEGRRAS